MVDIVLAKGGPEAIAESFYNCMRCQQLPGGQSNWVLTTRAKVAWCLPSIEKCDNVISEAVDIYHAGDEQINRHRENLSFTSNKHKNFSVSKVIDRVDADRGRCPFLAQ